MSSSRTSSPWSLIKRPSVCGRSSPGKASSHRWKDSGCQWSSNSVPRRPPKVDNVLEWQILVCAEWLIVWRAQWQSAFQEINPSCIINLFFFFLIIMFINSITVHVLLQRTHESRVAGHIVRTTRKHTHKSHSLQCKSAKINGPKNRILVFINLIKKSIKHKILLYFLHTLSTKASNKDIDICCDQMGIQSDPVSDHQSSAECYILK